MKDPLSNAARDERPSALLSRCDSSPASDARCCTPGPPACIPFAVYERSGLRKLRAEYLKAPRVDDPVIDSTSLGSDEPSAP